MRSVACNASAGWIYSYNRCISAAENYTPLWIPRWPRGVRHSSCNLTNIAQPTREKLYDRYQTVVVRGIYDSTVERPKARVLHDIHEFRAIANGLLRTQIEHFGIEGISNEEV